MNPLDRPCAAAKNGHDISILCVEDDAITREFLGTILSIEFPDQTVHTAENGQVGLEKFQKIDADIVLTDISMPVMDGIRMAREIRHIDPDACIFALSAHSHSDCQAEDIDTLFDQYLLKPINGKYLCNIVREYIDRIAARK